MRRRASICLTITMLAISSSACSVKSEEEPLSSAEYSLSEETTTELAKPAKQKEETVSEETNDDAWKLPDSFVGSWQLDIVKTKEKLEKHNSLSEVFGSELGAYGSSMEIDADGFLRCFIGSGSMGTYGSGQCRAGGEGILVSIIPFQDKTNYEDSLKIRAESGQEANFLIMKYRDADLYWSKDPDGERYFVKDGIYHEKVPDLSDGLYHWASAVSDGNEIRDDHGHETTDYQSQIRRFVCLDDEREIEVRRWDNLGYSAGPYLIFEYDGTIHISKNDDLYHPVLSLSGGFGIISKVSDGYMAADSRNYTITFYSQNFEVRKVVTGYRAMEDNTAYQDGLMAVRDMETGLMGYMNEEGEVAIACEYGYLSNFSNGYASVLVGANLIPYSEESGAISMFDTEGGQWGIIDTHGSFVVEPSERFANQEASDLDWYCGTRRFSPVREDGTVDFVALDEDERVIETIQIPNLAAQLVVPVARPPR